MNVMGKKSGMQALACGQGCHVTPATGWSVMTRAGGRKWGSWSECQSFIDPLC